MAVASCQLIANWATSHCHPAATTGCLGGYAQLLRSRSATQRELTRTAHLFRPGTTDTIMREEVTTNSLANIKVEVSKKEKKTIRL